MMRQSIVVLLACALCSLLPGARHAVASPRRHEAIDYDALEVAWATDDAPEELRSAADDHYARLEDASSVDAKALGPQMVFVTLDSEASTQEPLSALAGRWKEMLWNGGVDANIYEIEATKVLIGLQKGIYVRELGAFLDQQPEVVEFEWNGKKYRPGQMEARALQPSTTATSTKSKTTHKKRRKRKHEAESPPIPTTATLEPTHDDL